jgi:hypothetical protein
MHNAKSLHIIILIGLLLSLSLSACDVHEFPMDISHVTPGSEEVRAVHTVRFDFKFDTDWQVYPIGITLVASRAEDHTLKVRHTINFYAGHDLAASGVNAPDYSYTLLYDVTESLDFSTEFDIPEGQYTCLVWTDYVYEDGLDLYYNTLDFHKLGYTDLESYRTGGDDRIGFCGKEEFHATASTGSVTVNLKSPLAHYELLVSGLGTYLAGVLDLAAEDIDISDYSVTVGYSGFTPSKLNLFSGNVCDYWTDLTYSVTPRFYHEGSTDFDDDILLASDYVFVNDSETTLSLYLEVRDKDSSLILKTSAFTLPLIRDCDTVVRGSFITNTGTGGAVIDSEYSGEYNIQV